MLLAENQLRERRHDEAELLFLYAYERFGATPADLWLKAAAEWRARVEALRSPSGG